VASDRRSIGDADTREAAAAARELDTRVPCRPDAVAMRPLPLAFLDHRPSRAVGLNALDAAEWLWPDELYDAEMAQRDALLEQRPGEVLALLPEAEEAARELLALVAAFLLEHHRDRFRRCGGGGDHLLVGLGDRRVDLADPNPLRAAGRLVQEDLCLLQANDDGESYRLTGAALCFPAHWRLREKLGRPLGAIHDPVPGFAERLEAPVDRLFATLAAERPVWRANWSVVENATLHHPHARTPVPDLTAENAGEKLWLRVERQTLRRLPASRAIVFTIRTLVRPLGEVVAEAATARALAARVRELDPAVAAYKGLPALAPALLGWLDRRAAAGDG
jgi:hypothetical protein